MNERLVEEIEDSKDEILAIIDMQTKGATTARTKFEPKIKMIHPDDKVDNHDDEEEYPR